MLNSLRKDVLQTRPAPTQGEFDTGPMVGQATVRDSSTKRMRHWGVSRSYVCMTHVGMISYQGLVMAGPGNSGI